METNQQFENETGGQITAYHDEIEQIQKEGHERTIRSARNMLFIAAGMVMLSYIVTMIGTPDIINIIDMSIMIFFVGSFVGLGFWTQKKPYTAIIGGIVVLLLFILFNVVVGSILDGAEGGIKALFRGILFKIIILIALLKPLKDAKALQEMMAEKR